MEPSPLDAGRPASEYVCTLQPPEGSALARKLEACRAACQREVGPDEASLYPPHVSVTGFFHATPQQAARVCVVLARLVPKWARRGRLHTEVRGVVSTDNGHVILDIHAPGVSDLATALTAQVDPLGIRLRPKAVRHLSLGKGRRPLEQESIARRYAEVPLGACELDLVVSRLVHRSDVARLCSEGRAHEFRDILRVSLPDGLRRRMSVDRFPIRLPLARALRTPVKRRCSSSFGCALLDKADVRTPAIEAVATPLRKRRRQEEANGQDHGNPGGAAADGTPPKGPAPRDMPRSGHVAEQAAASEIDAARGDGAPSKGELSMDSPGSGPGHAKLRRLK